MMYPRKSGQKQKFSGPIAQAIQHECDHLDETMADMQNVTLLCKKSYENYVRER